MRPWWTPTVRAFDVPNLYICDNSVFPSALSVNPALTIIGPEPPHRRQVSGRFECFRLIVLGA